MGCLIFIGHFLQISPMINGSFVGNDLHPMHLGIPVPRIIIMMRIPMAHNERSFSAKEPYN